MSEAPGSDSQPSPRFPILRALIGFGLDGASMTAVLRAAGMNNAPQARDEFRVLVAEGYIEAVPDTGSKRPHYAATSKVRRIWWRTPL